MQRTSGIVSRRQLESIRCCRDQRGVDYAAENIFQSGTIVEGFSTDGGDACGNSDGVKENTAIKGGIADGGHRGGDDGVAAPGNQSA